MDYKFVTKTVTTQDEALVNGRIKFLPDENGVFRPYELLCFEKSVFLRPGYEILKKERKPVYVQECLFGDDWGKEPDPLEVNEEYQARRERENRRKSYCRARNNLFDILTCTVAFDSFATLTLSAEQIDRYDYSSVVKKLGQWLDNRVRRNSLVYAFVPEKHKDGAIHFHGLINKSAVRLTRAVNPYNGNPLTDDDGREVFNIQDFPFGFTTVIPLSGENARIATAKYCYKYITKSGGEKVGGRYYLSGGAVGHPRYEYGNFDYRSLDAETLTVGGCMDFKKIKF